MTRSLFLTVALLASGFARAETINYKCLNRITLKDAAQSYAFVMLRGEIETTDHPVHVGPIEMALLDHTPSRKFSSAKLGRTDEPAVFDVEKIRVKATLNPDSLSLNATADDGSTISLRYTQGGESIMALNIPEDDPEDHLQTVASPVTCLFVEETQDDWVWPMAL